MSEEPRAMRAGAAGATPLLPASVTETRFWAGSFPLAHAAMIVFLTVVYLAVDGADADTAVALAAATVAVAVGGARSGWADPERTDAGPVVVWVGLVGLWIPLVFALDPFFLQAMFTLFPVTFTLHPWPRSAVAALVPPATWGIVELRLDGSIWEWLVLPLAIWFLSCAFAAWITRVIDQSEERAALLTELSETRAELADAERRAGGREERERMAREIHDTLAQGFTSIVLHARGALASADGEAAVRTLRLVEEVAADHLAEARRLVSDGSPDSIGDRTLVDALRRVADAEPPHASLHVDGEVGGLGGAIEVGVLRIVQEAVANARKHACAHRIDVTLALAGDQVLVDVVDDGAGFDVSAPPRPVGGGIGGQGLSGLRRRVDELGGTIVIETEPGSGTSVSVALPVGST